MVVAASGAWLAPPATAQTPAKAPTAAQAPSRIAGPGEIASDPIMCWWKTDKNAVQLGLNKKMTFGGILCGNDVAVGMPVDDLVGSVWGYVWGPEAGGDAKRVYNALKPGVSAVDWRQYLGYQAGRNLINRIEHAGTTDTEKLVEAFENYHYDADKKSGAYFRKCDHQAVQQTYAGRIVASNKRTSPNEYFVIASTVGGDYAAENCSNPDSAAAAKIIGSEKIGPREAYTAVKV